MSREILNSNFNVDAKYEDMLNASKRIVEYHEFVSNGSCEPPSYICLAYDVKNYLPKLLEENQEQKEVMAKAIKELFNLKDMIYRPETREENIEIQRKISSIITNLKSNNSERGGINEF